jgi:hypothetical protein
VGRDASDLERDSELRGVMRVKASAQLGREFEVGDSTRTARQGGVWRMDELETRLIEILSTVREGRPLNHVSTQSRLYDE